MENPHVILASASPARLRTLGAAGVTAEVLVSGVDESTVEATRAETLSLVLARMKAEAVVRRLYTIGRGKEDLLVLGCDSVLAFDGKILGKPDNATDATARWKAMRGKEGVLHTGHCLIGIPTGKHAEANAQTVVRFADVSDAEIEAYVATGEPLAVAGAFTIDGRGGFFVESIVGDAGTVIGLSLPTFRRLLAEHGVSVADLWSTGSAV